MQPDTKLQFIIEVDVSDSRVGAVLSQWSGLQGNLQPRTFSFWQLIPTVLNYDVEHHWRCDATGWRRPSRLLLSEQIRRTSITLKVLKG